MTKQFILPITWLLLASILLPCHALAEPKKEAKWENPLKKEGYLDSPLVEATPFVFNDRLYLMESWQAFWDIEGATPGTDFHNDSARIRDVETGEVVSTALTNCGFAHAFVWKDRVYVFAGDYGKDKPWRRITEIVMTSSDDLKTWTKPVTVITAAGDELLWNTAVCRGKDNFILLYETNDKRWPAFTFKYCESDDLKNWSVIPEAIYGRKKYVGGPALYYEGDWYYTLYLQWLGDRKYETRITRSRDLLLWQDAPEGRPFVTFDEGRTGIPLRPANVKETNASDAELCYFNGDTIVYFTGSDQQVAGDLQRATFDGTPRQLFEQFFNDEGGADTVNPAHAGDWYPVLVKNDQESAELSHPHKSAATIKPSPRQLKYQEAQLGAFVHFGPASYNGSDMLAVPPADLFNPVNLDTEQWVLAAKSFGAKHIVITAKHHNGYCLWQTETTDYSVASSPWKNGKGDVIRELADACAKHGLNLGIYLSGGDFKLGVSATPDPLGKRKLRGDRDAYFHIYMQQVKELLTNYGPVVCLWIDGAYNPFDDDVMDASTGEIIGPEHANAITAYVHALQPDAVVFGITAPDVRWSGSEQGWAPYPLWNVVEPGEGRKHWVSNDISGWFLPEAVIHTRSTWFWTPNSDHTLKSSDALMKVYDESIGRGANLLVNLTPDTTGRISEVEVQRLNEFGMQLTKRFSNPIKSISSNAGWTAPGQLEITFDAPRIVTEVIIEEDLQHGQNVVAYSLEGLINGQWTHLSDGLTIGRKRIESIKSTEMTAIRLHIRRSLEIPRIRSFTAYGDGNEKLP